MSPEERRMLSDLFDRVRNTAGNQRDREAEDLIAQKLREQPYAAYYLAQAVIVQEQALQATTARLQELEDHVEALENGARQPQSQSTGFLGSLGTLFGGGQQRPDPHRPYGSEGRLYDDYARSSPPPMAAPSPWGRDATPGPWSQPAQSSSGGFLRGALSTAAGVAGGVLAADAIRDLFSSHMGGTGANVAGGFANLGAPSGDTIVNNYFMDDDKNGSNDNIANAGNDDDGIDIFDGDDDSFNA